MVRGADILAYGVAFEAMDATFARSKSAGFAGSFNARWNGTTSGVRLPWLIDVDARTIGQNGELNAAWTSETAARSTSRPS